MRFRYHVPLILALTVGLYLNALPGAWHYDDFHSITDNQAIRSLANVPRFFTDPTCFSANPDMAMYRPVLLVSYVVQHALTGPGVGWWHIGNLALHGVNACLVGWIGTSLLGPVGVAAGYLFAAHPLVTEPVNYVSGRSDLLMAVWWLLAVGLALRRPTKRVWLVWVCVGLALLTKESAVTLPAVLLLAWAWPHPASVRSLWWRRRAVVGALLVGAYLAGTWILGTLGDSLAHPARPWLTHAITQVTLLPTYLGLLVAPLELTVEHEVVALTRPVWQTWVVLAGMVAAAGLLPWIWRRSRLAVFLLAWGVLALLPVQVMPLNVSLNERRLYLPLAAFCLGLVAIGRKWQWSLTGPVWGAVLSLYIILTFARNPVWASGLSLWQDAVAKGPAMPRSWIYLGNAYADLARQYRDGGHLEQARKTWLQAASCYQRVRELATDMPIYCRATNNLGSVWLDQRNLDRAESLFREALALDSTYADVWVNLGNCTRVRAAAQSGRHWSDGWALAAIQYHRALELQPDHLEANVNLGHLWQALGDTSWARYYLARAQEIRPDDVRWGRWGRP